MPFSALSAATNSSIFDESLCDWYAPSGNYALLAGDSSDHITACGCVRFETKKLPYFEVGVDTTMGELLADPRTAPVVRQLMAEQASRRSGEDSDGISGNAEQDNAMQEAMMKYMPLKSMMSFGVMDRAQMESLLEMLRSLVNPAK